MRISDWSSDVCSSDLPDDPRLCFTKAIPGSSTRNRRRNPAMTSPRLTGPSETTLTQDLLYAGRYYLGGRRGLLILAAVAIVAGLALNWSWLVAVGIAPILLGVLPCLAMFALGLCLPRSEERRLGKECVST